MVTNNWLPYYVLYMQQQQRAKKAEEEKKKAEEEARKAQEEAQQQAEVTETEQKVEESSTGTQPQEEQKTEEQKVETTTETETKKEEIPTVSEKVESKPQTTTVVNTYTPKSTDCELLYEVGSSDYATCDYARAQTAQANSNIAMMLMFCVMAGIGIAALIVHCVDRKVDEEYRSGKGGGYFLG